MSSLNKRVNPISAAIRKSPTATSRLPTKTSPKSKFSQEIKSKDSIEPKSKEKLTTIKTRKASTTSGNTTPLQARKPGTSNSKASSRTSSRDDSNLQNIDPNIQISKKPGLDRSKTAISTKFAKPTIPSTKAPIKPSLPSANKPMFKSKQFSELESQHEKLVTEHSVLNTELNILQQKFEHLNSLNTKIAQSLSEAETKWVENETLLKLTYQAQIDALESTLESETIKLSESSIRNTDLTTQLTNLQVQSQKIIKNHEFTIKTLESDLEHQISDKNLKISTQENIILSQKVEIKQLQLDFTEQTTELETLVLEKDTLVSSLAFANDQISEITKSKLDIEQNFEENLKQKLEEKLKPYQNAKNEIDSYQEVLDMKNKKIRDLIEKLAVAEECSRDQLETKIVVNDMKVNERRLHEEISEWAEKHRGVERKMVENDSRMMSLKQENTRLVQDLEQSQFRLQNISDYESEVTRLNDFSGLSNNSFGELPTGDGASTPVKKIQLDFSSSGRSSLREPIMSPGIDRIPLTPNRSNFNPSFEPSAELHNTSIGGSLMLTEESSTIGRK